MKMAENTPLPDTTKECLTKYDYGYTRLEKRGKSMKTEGENKKERNKNEDLIFFLFKILNFQY